MAVTSKQLIEAAQLTPNMLGAEIIDPDGSDAQRSYDLEKYVKEKILSPAESEVLVPYMEASNGNPMPLPDSLIVSRYPDLAAPERGKLIDSITKLYDLAWISYARSEINKQIASDAEEYDRDSDQDRIQGNQRLEKLLVLVRNVMSGTAPVAPVVVSPQMTLPPASTSVRLRRVW